MSSLLTQYHESVVQITNTGTTAFGSGFVIHHEGSNTYILTCKHVVDAVARKDDPGRSVLINSFYPAKPNHEPKGADPDLSVLVTEAPELRDKPAFTLGRLGLTRSAVVFSYFQSSDEERAAPARVPYEISSRSQTRLTLENQRWLKIIRGHSGSPVLDDKEERVIGVVSSTPFQRRRDAEQKETGIGVIPIEFLRDVWPEMPVRVHEPDASAPIAIQPELINRIRGLRDNRLRVLLAGSAPTSNGDVNGEMALLKETLEQTLGQPAMKEHLDLEVWECAEAGQASRVIKTQAPNDEESTRLNLPDYDLVLIVVWHNLGSGLDLEKLERKARELAEENSERLPLRLIYWRKEELKTSVNDPTAQEQRMQLDQVGAFFRELAAKGLLYKKYTKETFAKTFLEDLPEACEKLVAIHEGRTGAGQGAQDRIDTRLRASNPYRGLSRYQQNEGALFFGRTEEVNHLCGRLGVGEHRFIAVVGASGCGKSSLVRAGLLYRLALDAIPGSRHWQVIDLSLKEYPDSPLYGLARELDRLLADSPENPFRGKRIEHLAWELRTDASVIETAAQAILATHGAGTRLIILIDQFEEIFTLVDDAAEQVGFARFLANAIRSDRINVVITVRADYYDRVLGLAPLADVLQSAVYSPPAPSPNAFLAIITCPALFNGLRFEDSYLPLEILLDAGTESGALPLLSYALEQLAEPARLAPGNLITRRAFKELGGVRGIIAQQAESAIRHLGYGTREKVAEDLNRIFWRLVDVDERGNATRKPAPYRDDDSIWNGSARQLARELIDRRLLQTGTGGGHPTIEISHEALLSHWPRLEQWVSSVREFLVLRRRAEVAAKEWNAARCKTKDELAALAIDRAFLWPHARLQEVDEVLRRLGIDYETLDEVVQRFLRPERQRLLDELILPIDHARRAWIGDRLAELGDPRRGVGLRSEKLPDLVWCHVPHGRQQINGITGLFEVSPFFISKFVVTLAQFNAFAQGKPYEEPRWWQDLPIKPSEHPPIRQYPEIPNYPAQFVSWYQAFAYCRWLSHVLGYTVRLPTEWEWQQAATGGNQDFLYPWGPQWHPEYANTREGGVGHLMSVGLYPVLGASPVGALDMSGNMYEWCANEFENVHNLAPSSDAPRTTRGGAFFTLGKMEAREGAKVTARLKDNANGYNESGNRIRVCVRLACDQPPHNAVVALGNH